MALTTELLTFGLPRRHTRFKMTDVGKVPSDWAVRRLGELLEGIDAGWSPACETRTAAPGEWGVLKVSAVSGGEFRPEENKKLPDGFAPRPDIEVHRGDLLLSRANTRHLVGRSVVVGEVPRKLMLSDKLLRLRLQQDVADSRYVNIALDAPLVRSQIEEGATGTSRSMKNISQEKLHALLLPVPSLDEQHQMGVLFDELNMREIAERRLQDGLLALRAALMTVVLSGKVLVTQEGKESVG